MATNPNPSGLCMCGCGQRTEISKQHDKRKGAVRGFPRRYVKGHSRCAKTLNAYVVDDVSGCWLWTGPRHKRIGYGRVMRSGKYLLAHRWIYERERGPIPEGLILHHECENNLCVNPGHLRPMTRGEHQSMHMRERMAA
jgi:hypothetical protein